VLNLDDRRFKSNSRLRVGIVGQFLPDQQLQPNFRAILIGLHVIKVTCDYLGVTVGMV